MDLKNLMNDDDKAQSRGSETSASSSAPPPAYGNPQPSTPSHYHHSSQQQTPLYAPPSAGGTATYHSQSHGMTPLRTPSQTTGSAQYPFPQQAQQSPVSGAPGQPYRPSESQASTTPGRPPSHGHVYHTSQSGPPPYGGQGYIHQQQHGYTSISPTPPSHLSRTSSSMRQSPMATWSHLPSQQQHHQYSQPNTPLGPPTHLPQRAPTLPDTQSPHRQRSFSNASNGLVSGSPAQQYPGIPSLVESPSALARPSPQHSHSRRQSEYLQSNPRERSPSVSPKTKPPPRIPSLGSQQSSNTQELYSARASEQYSNAPLAGSPNHVPQPHAAPSQYQSTPRFAPHPNAASEVPQTTPPSLQPAPSVFASSAQSQSSLSSQTSGNDALPPQPLSISHQSQKMGMNHLVTPASEVPPAVNGSSTSHPAAPFTKPRDGPNIFMDKKRSATPQNRASYTPPPASTNPQIQEDLGPEVNPAHSDVHMADAGTNGAISAVSSEPDTKASLKRPASSSNSLEEPPSKQVKQSPLARKYTERPIWARLSKHNPRFEGHGQTNGAPKPRQQAPRPRVNGGGPVKPAPTMSQPEQQSGTQPVDTDMVRIRGILGDWERSFTNSQPLPDTKRVVADWLFRELFSLQDVGNDPQYGAIEIEGKIGTLFNKESGQRCDFPVLNTVILNPRQCEQYRFESRMEEAEHSHMNQALNDHLRRSMDEPGRVKLHYKHFTDIDSFVALSPAGLAALPASVRDRLDPRHHHPKLRITTRHEKGRKPYVAARIVKVNVANLHVYSPNDPYDLRISINVEVNLERPDLHHEDLIILPSDPEGEKDPQPDRKKDRISYNHLCYQIDLTRVDVSKQRPKYELEIEVDAAVLRGQMDLGKHGAFGDVVAGFWDDAVTLMREKPPM